MKNKKRIIAFILSLVLICTSCPTVFAAGVNDGEGVDSIEKSIEVPASNEKADEGKSIEKGLDDEDSSEVSFAEENLPSEEPSEELVVEEQEEELQGEASDHVRTTTLDLRSVNQNMSDEAQKWAYDVATNTLTLSGVDFEEGDSPNYNYLKPDTTIVLSPGTVNNFTKGFYSDGNINIKGSGVLNINPVSNYYDVLYTRTGYAPTTLTIADKAVVNLVSSRESSEMVDIGYLRVTDATLNIKSKYEYQLNFNGSGYYYDGMVLQGVTLKKGNTEDKRYLSGDSIGDGWYEILIEPENGGVCFDKNTKVREIVSTSVDAAVAPKISVHAYVSGSNTKVSYQWYEVPNSQQPIAAAKKVNCTTETFTVPTTVRGANYYICEAYYLNDGKRVSAFSNAVAVAVAAKDKKAITGYLQISNTQLEIMDYFGRRVTVENLSDYGISFTAKTAENPATVTFTDATIANSFSAFSSRDDAVIIGCSTKFAFYGNNVIDTSDQAFNIRPSVGDIEFCGNISNGSRSSLDATECNRGIYRDDSTKSNTLSIKDVSIEMSRCEYCNFANINLNNADVKINGVFGYGGRYPGDLTLSNNSSLLIEGTTGIEGNLSVDNTSAMSVVSSTNMGFLMCDAANKTMTINGTFSAKSNVNGAIRFKGLDVYDAEHMENKGTSVVKTPEGGLTSANFELDSSVMVFTGDEVFIAPDSFAKKTITSVANITGDQVVNGTLTAGAVSPKNATVSYQWQYASTANASEELWTNIPEVLSNSKKITLPALVANKYVRVKVTGCGDYKGTVYSNVAGPIAENPTLLSDIVFDNNPSLLSGFNPRYTSSTFSVNVNKMPEADGTLPTVNIHAIPATSEATVIIKNTTNKPGITKNVIYGEKGDLQLYTDGEIGFCTNNVTVTVKYRGITTTYKFNVYVNIQNAQLKLYTTTDSVLRATWNDGVTDQSITTEGGTSASQYIKPGTEVTVTSIAKDGFYLRNFAGYAGIDKYNNALHFDEDGNRSVTFRMENTSSPVSLYANSDNYFGVKPPEVEARWGYTSGEYMIRVNGPMTLESTYYYGKTEHAPMMAILKDSKGNLVNLRSNAQYGGKYYKGFTDGLWTDSGDIYAWNSETSEKVGLDPTESYTLLLGYRYADTDLSDDTVFMKEIKLKPVNDTISLKFSKDSLIVPVLEESKVYNIPAQYSVLATNGGADGIEHIYPADGGIGASLSNQELHITVPANATPGVYYVKMSIDRGDKHVMDTFKLEVVPSESLAKVYCKSTKGTLNIYEEGGIKVPLAVSGNGSEITSATFVQAGLSNSDFNPTLCNKFKIDVVDNRTLSIVPKTGTIPDDSYAGNYATLVKSLKGNIKAYIKVTFADGSTATSSDPYTLKVDAKAPTVKVKTVQFNSFYIDEVQNIDFTGSSAAVLKAKVDQTKATSTTPAIPTWLTLSEDGKQLTLNNANLVKNSGNGKVNLNVWLKGYQLPVQVAVSASAKFAEPKVALSLKSIDVPSSIPDFTEPVSLSIASTDKKVSYSSLNITSLRTATSADIASLSAKDQAKYSISSDYKIYTFNKESGVFKICPKKYDGQLTAGTLLLVATIGDNDNQEIMLPLAVKTIDNSKVTIKADKTKVTVNKGLGKTGDPLEYSVDIQDVRLTPSATGFNIGKIVPLTGQKSMTVYVLDAKSTSTMREGELTVSQDAYDLNLFHIRANKNTAHTDYIVRFKTDGVAKAVDVKVTVTTVLPKLTLSSNKVTLDRIKLDSSNAVTETVNVKLSGGYSFYTYALSDLNVKVYKGKTGAEEVTYDYIYADKHRDSLDPTSGRVRFELGNSVTNGDYRAVLTYNLPDGETSLDPIVVNITVKNSVPTLKLEKNTVTLNKQLQGNGIDVAKTKVTCSEGKYSSFGYDVLDSKGKPITSSYPLDVQYNESTQTISVRLTSYAEYGASYKVNAFMNVSARGNNVRTKAAALTVKVPKENNTAKAITSKLKANGAINLSIKNSGVEIVNTYAGWNGNIYDDEALNKPTVTWKVYAKDGNKPYTGTLSGANGLVATSESPADSWFKDTDDSYGINLVANTSCSAWDNGVINPALKYTIEVTTTFDDYINGTDPLVVTSSVALPVKQETFKSVATPTAVTMSKVNKYDSQLVKINLSSNKMANLNIIYNVELDNAAKSQFEIIPIHRDSECAYVAIFWKNKTVPTSAKTEKLKIMLYQYGNDTERNKPNGTVDITVKVN